MANPIHIQIVYALSDREWLRSLEVEEGCTIGQAIVRSGLLQEGIGIDLDHNPVGIYGKKKTLDTPLREHDRIEIYRPLQADPKEARRRRASRKA